MFITEFDLSGDLTAFFGLFTPHVSRKNGRILFLLIFSPLFWVSKTSIVFARSYSQIQPKKFNILSVLPTCAGVFSMTHDVPAMSDM
jgi:hypothetical protein